MKNVVNVSERVFHILNKLNKTGFAYSNSLFVLVRYNPLVIVKHHMNLRKLKHCIMKGLRRISQQIWHPQR